MSKLFDLLNDLAGGGAAPQQPTGHPPAATSGHQAAQQGSVPTSGLGGLDGLLSGKGNLAGAAAAGGLAGLLLGNKKGRKLAGNALKVGGLAVAGGLAYKAFRDWQAQKAGTPGTVAEPEPVARDRFLPTDPVAADTLCKALVAAMIGAAKADGEVSQAEFGRIGEKLNELSLSDEDEAFVRGQLDAPLDVGAIADLARNREEAAEIYAASLMVVEPPNAAEQGYLAMLAARLRLDQDLVDRLHAEAATLEVAGA